MKMFPLINSDTDVTDRSGLTYGVVLGIVTNNKDEDNMGRIKVRFPWLSDTDESVWARLAMPSAGAERGMFFLPEVEDEVLVAFEHGDINRPYIIGALWSKKDKPPLSNDDGKNNKKQIRTRSGHTVTFDDTEGSETITIADKTGNNTIVFDSAKNTIIISSAKDIAIKAPDGAVTIEAQTVKISAQQEMKLDSAQSAAISSGAGMKLKGATIDLN